MGMMLSYMTSIQITKLKLFYSLMKYDVGKNNRNFKAIHIVANAA